MSSDMFGIPVQPVVSPLDENDKNTLLQIIADNSAQMDVVEKCEFCELDMTEQRARAAAHKRIAHKFLFKFFNIPMPTME